MDLFIAVSLTGLLLLFLGLCFCRALLPIHGAFIVLLAQGDGADLEHKLYTLFWLQGVGVLRCPVCILNQGLNETGFTMVEHLLKRWPEITLWEDWGIPKK